MRLISELSIYDIPAEIYPESSKMKKQMEYANRRGIPYVVIIGSNELEQGIATVKNMRSAEQSEVSFKDIVSALQ